MILYEYPFNERIRAYLRLEHLFERLFYFARPGNSKHHQIAVTTLFDILDILERTDIKTAVLQDLERHRVNLAPLRDHPDVVQETLESTLHEMEKTTTRLLAPGKTAQSLRENDWLISVRGRLGVPGGATQLEVPSYYAWQHKPEAERSTNLQSWIVPLLPLHDGLTIALRMLRESGHRGDCRAEQGTYQQMLGGKAHQLLQVWVEGSNGVFPEISGNKHMIWIRFSVQNGELKPYQVAQDVNFQMSLCSA